MKLQVQVEGRGAPVEIELKEVRDHFAFTVDGCVFCLDDGWLFCSSMTGVRLTSESLAKAQALEIDQNRP